MKLTKVQFKISTPIYIIPLKCFDKISYSTSSDVRNKIHNEIRSPNTDLIERMQRTMISDLQNF